MKKFVAVLAVVALAVGLSGCEGKSKAQTTGQHESEQAFEQQSKAVPYPVNDLRDSQERRNLKERLLRQNDPDRIGYVYLLSFGNFIGYYTIKGKLSSTQSQMTTDQLIAKPCDGCDRYVVDAPGDDGSYGPNEDGVFFFTTEGAMVQVDTNYIYSDQPIAVGNIPELNGDEKVESATSSK